ncbi:MAG: alpha/beta hydrolase [Elusimicrobia bacterium]|nr:alpha/beta hydrolase [Elusimicrobiota bacterium]
MKTKKFLKNILTAIPVFAFIYVFMALIGYFFQKGLIYDPSRRFVKNPENVGLNYEDVYFETSDGIKLNGWFVPQPAGGKVILFCHGNADNISFFCDSIKQFRDLGFGVFAFDWRGYGRSEGSPSEKGTYLDVLAAWNWLVAKKGISPGGIIVLGRSLGSSPAAWLCCRHKPFAAVIESGFYSLKEIASQRYPFFPVGFILKYRYETGEYLKKILCPVLVVHSRDDRVIPFSHGLRLFEAARPPKKFLEIRGTHRNGHLTSENYASGLLDFVRFCGTIR